MKYADAPGTLSSDAAINPPADDSAIAIVSFRCLSKAPIFSARGSRSFIASLPFARSLGAGGFNRLDELQRHPIAFADRNVFGLVGISQSQGRWQRPHPLCVVLGVLGISVEVG